MLERDGQKRYVKRLRNLGWTVIKVSVCSLIGFPDLILIRSPGVIEFHECKRGGGKRTVKQKVVAKKLQSLGFTVRLISVETFQEIFDDELVNYEELF